MPSSAIEPPRICILVLDAESNHTTTTVLPASATVKPRLRAPPTATSAVTAGGFQFFPSRLEEY